jgi:hypothetical protein
MSHSKRIDASLGPKGTAHERVEIFRLIFWSWARESGIYEKFSVDSKFGVVHLNDISNKNFRRGPGAIAKDLGLSPRTVEGVLREFRERIAKSPRGYTNQLNKIVHIDTWTYRPHLTKHPAPRPTILGMMSNDGQLRLFEIFAESLNDIYPLVEAHLAKGSRLITSGLKVHSVLKDQTHIHLERFTSDKHLRDWLSQKGLPSLFDFWEVVEDDIHCARGVRDQHFLPRVREAELRWEFRKSPRIDLYRHAIALMNP